ncbi:MAG: ABC transporter substrate-binding protein [Chloroflexi bacterium]|nr:ABC transporter substrate-binding protein [Chloroflexota bacterium]
MNLLKTFILLSIAALLSSCAAFPWLPQRQTLPLGRLTGNAKDAGSAKDGMNLGMVVDLTGPLALAGKDAIAGAELAIEQLNEAGGIKEQRVRLLVRDAGGAKAAAQAQSLVSDYQVSGIIAPLSSNDAYSIAQAVERRALVFTYVANAAYMTTEWETPKSLFQIGPSDYMESKAQAVDLSGQKYGRYFVVGADTVESRARVSAFEEWLAKLQPGVTFLGAMWLSPGQHVYGAAIDKALAAQPDLVYSTLEGSDLEAFTRQAKARGFFERVAFTAPYDVGVLQSLKSDMVSGVRAYSRAPFFALSSAPAMAFVQRYWANTGKYPSDAAVLAYEAARVWAQVGASSDSLSWSDLLRVAEGMKFEFLMGSGYLRSLDHQSSLGSFVGYTQWSDTYGFMTYRGLKYLSADGLWRPEGEVKEIKERPPASKLAMVSDISKELASVVKDAGAAAELAVEEINRNGGLLARQVKLVQQDASDDAQRTAEKLEELIIGGGVSAVIGPVSNSTAAQVIGIAKVRDVAMFFSYANSERLTMKLYNEKVFQVGPSTYMTGRLQALALSEEKYTRYYLLGPRIGAAQEEANAFKEWMQKLRPDVRFVGEVWLPMATQDYAPAINTILAARPEMVYSNLQGEDLVRFTRQAKSQKFFEQVAFAASYDVGVLQELKGDMPSGVKTFARAPFFASDDPGLKQFVNQYRARTSLYPSDAAVLTYQSVMLWAFAVSNANSVTGYHISRFLGGRQYASLFGPRILRSVDHQENAGIFTGYTEWSNEYGFMVFRDTKYLPPETVWRSPGEVSAIRLAP